MTKTVVLTNPIRMIVRGKPGPPGDITQPFPSIKMDTTTGDPASPVQGEVWWDQDEETFSLRQNGATLQFGQELQWHVRNNSGAQIDDGTVVMATGSIGATGRITIAEMDGTDPGNAKFILGIATEDIANNTGGKVSTFGNVGVSP